MIVRSSRQVQSMPWTPCETQSRRLLRREEAIVTGAQIDMRFSGHVTAMPAGVASIPTAPSWRAACVLRARLRRPDC